MAHCRWRQKDPRGSQRSGQESEKGQRLLLTGLQANP